MTRTLNETKPATSLSVLLRTATAEQHQRAERSEFVAALLSGRSSAAAYRALLVQHRAIYAALEAAADQLVGDPIAGAFVFPELRRLPAIEHDLRQLDAPDTTQLFPATTRYADRVRAVGCTPEGYLAHAYTRYLGDLSGGQVIGRIMHREYGVPRDALTFYDFPAIAKPKLFKDEFRARMDAAPFDDAGRDRVVQEARTAFDLNTALFTDLAGKYLP